MACAHQRRRCVDSRPRPEGRYRRFACDDCGTRFSTIEVEVEFRGTVDETIAAYRRRQLGELAPRQIADLQVARARLEEIGRVLDDVTRKENDADI